MWNADPTNSSMPAYKVDEVEDIRDRALALEIYAQQAKNVDAERDACEIRLQGRTQGRATAQGDGEAKGEAANGNPSY